MSLNSERLQKELSSLPDSEARTRLKGLFDDGNFTELDRFSKNGKDSLEVVTAFGSVMGNPCYAFSQDITINSGAMGSAQANKIKRVYELAEKTGYPVVGIFDSNGAHIDEGLGALTAYAELIRLSNRLSGVVPQISVIAGVCGGSGAVLALCSDVVVMSEKAELFLNPAQILNDRTGKTGSAKTAVANGTAHIAAADAAAAIEAAKQLVFMLPSNNLSAAAVTEYIPSQTAADENASMDEIITSIADANSILPLFTGFGAASKTVLARIGGLTVGIASAGGRENDRLGSDDCKKLASFVRLCDAFSVPIVTLIDTAGYEETAEGEFDGLVKGAAMLTQAYAEATTAKISVITGKAYGPVFITLAGKSANADAVLAWDSAVISTLRPETAVSILYNEKILAGSDRQSLIEEYISTKASAFEAAADGYIDDVIAPQDTFARTMSALDMLSSKRISILDKKHATISF